MDLIPGFSRHSLAGLAIGLTILTCQTGLALAGKRTSVISEDTLALHPEVVAMRQEVATHPENALLQAKLGNMYARLGWDDLAEASFMEAVRLDANLYEAWTNIGTIYSRQDKLGQAEQAFLNAIQLQPRAALAYYNLGTVLDRADRYDEALAAYKKAITYNPDLLDPAVNPQVVNNRHLIAIRLMSYLEDAGSGSLPLETFPEEAQTDPDLELEPDMEPAETTGNGADSPQASIAKPVLGTLIMTMEKESRSARRKRQKESDTTPEGSAPASSL
ncbi:MAG: tetratricopeptide repeat protein [Acidobacteria bacterium]|nr:tetratricopeptide repeat protein [Acidobacteriota bacterium]